MAVDIFLGPVAGVAVLDTEEVEAVLLLRESVLCVGEVPLTPAILDDTAFLRCVATIGERMPLTFPLVTELTALGVAVVCFESGGVEDLEDRIEELVEDLRTGVKRVGVCDVEERG